MTKKKSSFDLGKYKTHEEIEDKLTKIGNRRIQVD